MRAIQFFRTLGLSALLCGLHLAVTAASDTPVDKPAADKSVHVDVKGVQGAGLLHAMVQLIKVPLVSALPPETGPLAFKQTYENWPRAMEDIVKRTGLAAQNQNNLLMMRPACSQLALSARGPESSERVFLNFQQLPLAALLEALKVQPTVESKDQEAFERAALTISVWNIEAGNVLQAAASATGFRWAGDAQNGWRLERESSHDCAFSGQASRGTPRSIASFSKEYATRGIYDYCPHRVRDGRSTRPCAFFELYALHTLRPTGYVTLNGRSTGLLETPEGLTGLIRLGDYLGHDFGKVMGVEADGLTVAEIFQDEDEKWVEKNRVLRYGEKPKATQSIWRRRAYIEPDSPQKVYEDSVNALLLYTQQWDSAVQLCTQHHPDATEGLQAALADWRKRNSEAIDKVTRHATAYVGRAASDYAIAEHYLFDSLRGNIDKSVEVYFKIAGDLNSPAVRAICVAQAQLLQNPKNDLLARFPSELKALSNCSVERTCPNLVEQNVSLRPQ